MPPSQKKRLKHLLSGLNEGIVDVNETDKYGATYLMHAAWHEPSKLQFKVIKRLVWSGTNVLKFDNYKNNVMHVLCHTGNTKIIEYLCVYTLGYQLFDTKNNEGKSPIELCPNTKTQRQVRRIIESSKKNRLKAKKGGFEPHSVAETSPIHIAKTRKIYTKTATYKSVGKKEGLYRFKKECALAEALHFSRKSLYSKNSLNIALLKSKRETKGIPKSHPTYVSNRDDKIVPSNGENNTFGKESEYMVEGCGYTPRSRRSQSNNASCRQRSRSRSRSLSVSSISSTEIEGPNIHGYTCTSASIAAAVAATVGAAAANASNHFVSFAVHSCDAVRTLSPHSSVRVINSIELQSTENIVSGNVHSAESCTDISVTTPSTKSMEPIGVSIIHETKKTIDAPGKSLNEVQKTAAHSAEHAAASIIHDTENVVRTVEKSLEAVASASAQSAESAAVSIIHNLKHAGISLVHGTEKVVHKIEESIEVKSTPLTDIGDRYELSISQGSDKLNESRESETDVLEGVQKPSYHRMTKKTLSSHATTNEISNIKKPETFKETLDKNIEETLSLEIKNINEEDQHIQQGQQDIIFEQKQRENQQQQQQNIVKTLGSEEKQKLYNEETFDRIAVGEIKSIDEKRVDDLSSLNRNRNRKIEERESLHKLKQQNKTVISERKINEYNKYNEFSMSEDELLREGSAITLQGMWRGKRTRSQMALLEANMLREGSALRLQTLWREKYMATFDKDASYSTDSSYYYYSDKSIENKEKNKTNENDAYENKTYENEAHENKKNDSYENKILENMAYENEAYENEVYENAILEEGSAVALQGVWRGRLVRRQLRKEKEIYETTLLREGSAVALQGVWRGRSARKQNAWRYSDTKSGKNINVDKIRETEIYEATLLREGSAVALQGIWRGRSARKKISQKCSDPKSDKNIKVDKIRETEIYETSLLREGSAIALQGIWRGRSARKKHSQK